MTGNFWVVLPLICLIGGAFAVYLVARFLTGRNDLLALCTAAIFTVALSALALLRFMTSAEQLSTWGRFGPGEAFLRAEPGALMIASLAIGLGLLAALYSGHYLTLERRY